MIKFLAIFAVLLIALPAFGQEQAVKYNPNTGALIQPSAGKRPLVAAANVLEYSTDADLALTNAHNTVVWNVPAQALTRTITLPVVGDDPDETAQPVFVYIVDANADSVEVYDAGSNLLATQTAVELSRVTYYPVADGVTWIAVDQSFGTAAYVNTGTGGTDVPTITDADARYGRLGSTNTWTQRNTFSGKATVTGETSTSTDNTLLLGDNIAPVTGTSRVKMVIGNTNGISEFLMGQSGTNSLLFGWVYNATASSAYGLLETFAGNNPLGIQTAGGNVGIGIVNPTVKLDVAGTFRLGTAANNSSAATSIRFGAAAMATGTTGSVSDTPVTSGSYIVLSPEFAPSGTLYYTINSGVGFTILSTSALDSGRVSYQRIVP